MDKDWDDLDFPVWVSWESYNDDWEMSRKIEHQHGVSLDGVGMSDMKYTVFEVWFKVLEDGSVEGPYDEKEEELL